MQKQAELLTSLLPGYSTVRSHLIRGARPMQSAQADAKREIVDVDSP